MSACLPKAPTFSLPAFLPALARPSQVVAGLKKWAALLRSVLAADHNWSSSYPFFPQSSHTSSSGATTHSATCATGKATRNGMLAPAPNPQLLSRQQRTAAAVLDTLPARSENISKLWPGYHSM